MLLQRLQVARKPRLLQHLQILQSQALNRAVDAYVMVFSATNHAIQRRFGPQEMICCFLRCWETLGDEAAYQSQQLPIQACAGAEEEPCPAPAFSVRRLKHLSTVTAAAVCLPPTREKLLRSQYHCNRLGLRLAPVWGSWCWRRCAVC